jgi:Flp pilus assembly protein protease CpaA
MEAFASYGLMLVLVAAVTATDFRRRRIPNRLLLGGLILAVIIQSTFAAVQGWELLDQGTPWGGLLTERGWPLLTNVIVATLLAVGLYAFEMISAGDAKLLIVLAVAHPPGSGVAGPVPGAPIVVVLANGLWAALTFIVAEGAIRGGPRFAAWWRSSRGQRWEGIRGAMGVGWRPLVVLAAFSVALGPLRQVLGERLGLWLPGGAFWMAVLLFVLYKPLFRVAQRPFGWGLALAALVLSVLWMVAGQGQGAWVEVRNSLLVCTVVMVARGLVTVAGTAFDARWLAPSELRPEMVLAGVFLRRLAADEHWQREYRPILGDLRGMRLDDNLIRNLQVWCEHNAPGEPVAVAAPLPFAPALAAGLLVTIWQGQILLWNP